MREWLVGTLVCGAAVARPLAAQCGGEERWAVKMAADPGSSQIAFQNPAVIALHDLVRLPRPVLPTDEETRTPAEANVWVVEGRLVKFKQETSKTGDSDFHLVISDGTMLFSAGGSGTQASPHSVIAEIPDPDCVGGRNGTVSGPSRFATELTAVRAKFLQQFGAITSGWNDAQGIPVRLTGVEFFDRPHGQVGRALNGLELHPLLDIVFNPGPAAVVAVASGLDNPGFEDGGQSWTTTANVITTSPNQPAHSGSAKAWLGGYGATHSDRLSQQVTLPAAAHAISFSFFLHIDTEEDNQQAFDKLTIRVRDANGQLLKTLRTFSNQNAAPGYSLQTFDLTAFKGKTVRIELEAREDNGTETSFVVDDFSIVVENP
jgi:hypothetical protein